MKQTTLWMIVKDNKILLCMKKRWFWEWLWNWSGWKCEKDESIEDWMIRELYEETWLTTTKNDIEHYWVLHFYFKKDEKFNQDVNIFKINNYSWEPTETEEMRPKWFEIDEIPYDEIWEDDKIWLPEFLSWEKVEYDIIFWLDWKIESYKKY